MNYDQKTRLKNSVEVRAEAENFAREKPIYSLGEFKRLDTESVKKLRSFLQVLTDDRVRMIFFFPPYHPAVYETMRQSPEYRMVDQAEQAFKEIANEMNILMLGSYNPANLGLKDSDFYDGMHMRNESLTQFFKNHLTAETIAGLSNA